MKIVFFKIAWMREYLGNKNGSDEPIYSGMKNKKIEDVHEKYNFTPVRINDEDFWFGFFETKNYRKKSEISYILKEFKEVNYHIEKIF